MQPGRDSYSGVKAVHYINQDLHHGAFMKLVDQEIAHIMRVMIPSLQSASGIPILTPNYWYKRLSDLLDTNQLSHSQFRTIDALMTQIERIQAGAAVNEVRSAA